MAAAVSLMAEALQEQDRVNAEEKIINEEYKMWKKNSPFLYDVAIVHALMWPTLTVQWYPEIESEELYNVHKLLIGTHTSDNDQNYVEIVTVKVPKAEVKVEELIANDDQSAKISVINRIAHEGEVNRARLMPQSTNIIATKSISGDVFIFHDNELVNRLKGHTMEGYGLSWSFVSKGQLLSSADDGLVCHYDVNSSEPKRIYSGHASIVCDVQWHKFHETIFASVGDDKRLLLWDARSSAQKPSHQVEAHTLEVNSVDFSPSSEYLLATGSNDRTSKLWDLRYLKQPTHVFEFHREDVVKVCFNPNFGNILATSSGDRRVLLWDLSKIGLQGDEEGPAELCFMHGGHTSKVSDFSWNLNQPWLAASAAEDNILQVWQMSGE